MQTPFQYMDEESFVNTGLFTLGAVTPSHWTLNKYLSMKIRVRESKLVSYICFQDWA